MGTQSKSKPEPYTYKRYFLTLVLPLCMTTHAEPGGQNLETILVEGTTSEIPTMGIGNPFQKKGTTFYNSGGVAKIPVLNGLNDDRVKVVIDGAEVTSACANHMNPPLSYLNESEIQTITVYAGLTPVSMGGDSIAGTISVESTTPAFQEPGKSDPLSRATLGVDWASNGSAHRESLSAVLASDKLSLKYSGASDTSESYKDGRGNRVLDTLYKAENHALLIGARNTNQELTLRLTHQNIPYQGFPNQYMDMVDNTSNGANLLYRVKTHIGTSETRLIWQDVSHAMGFFTEEKTGSMPMLTEGENISLSSKMTLPINNDSAFSTGLEFHRFQLDDWWPAVEGHMMMGPNDFVNINDGSKSRLAGWIELQQQLSPAWSLLSGVRYEHTTTDTGPVQPYNSNVNMMMARPDALAAEAFNQQQRKQTDHNIDFTLSTRRTLPHSATLDIGYARKTRSPNLYERYSWGRSDMATTMIGWFGDGNGYVGNINLAPEIAHTLAATYGFQRTHNRPWQWSISPYYTYVDDYIDVTAIAPFNPRGSASVTRSKLQFINEDAELYGLDVSLNSVLWGKPQTAHLNLQANLRYRRGKRHYDNTPLYQIEPLVADAELSYSGTNWTPFLGVEWHAEKDRTDPRHHELDTDAYSLVNIGTRYEYGPISVRLDIANALDEDYALPLGGTNLAQWRANGVDTAFVPLKGPGRSVNLSFQLTL